MGGRIVLLKSVLSALPIYFLSFFKVPPGIISSIESLFKNFLWGGSDEAKKIHWVKWERVCKPKEEGGLGIKDLKLFNIALLGKWWWRLKNEDEALWHRVLVCRYGKSLDKVNIKSSIWWRDLNIIKNSPKQGGINWIEENLVKVVWNGRNTLFWRDPWVGGESLYKLFDRLYDISTVKDCLVSDMLIEEEGVRKINWRWRRNLFQWENELMEVCNSLVMGIERKEDEDDRWKWGGGNYSVKIAYQSLIEGEGEDPNWAGEVWSPLIPLRLSTLAWRLLQNRLPTKENLRRRGININSSIRCVGGCSEFESVEHLFFNCPILSMAWKEIARWLGISVTFAKGGGVIII
jgi:hypothetical protein